MKVLGISGSARKDGNTAILMEKVFEVLRKAGIETELVQLAGQVIEPCKACWACGNQGNCVHQKDIFKEVFEKMKVADGILLGSPVYSANVSANMQALLERAAVVGDMNYIFLNHEMFVAGSIYWNMGYGQMSGDVEKDQEALANMENLGQNMAYLLKALEEKR